MNKANMKIEEVSLSQPLQNSLCEKETDGSLNLTYTQITKLFDVLIDNSWVDFVNKNKNFKNMVNFINNTNNICPRKEKVFRFFECNLNKVRCIILGMDPYPSIYEENGLKCPVATGRAFEVANVKLWTDSYKQTSLANIFKALIYMKTEKNFSMQDIRNGIANKNIIIDEKLLNIHNWFDYVEKQGVIFLNSTLTTIEGKSDVHTSIWRDFMDELINYIVVKNSNIKWLIWGKNALNRVQNIVNNKNILYTCHPASRINNTFVKDCCFKKVNEISWII